ncbi:hypothetical protein BH24BAC1_BH24BAC1_21820 [soil metagenome]
MLIKKVFLSLLLLLFSFGLPGQPRAQQKAKKKQAALIVDGQSNHKHWPETTQRLKRYLEETGLFTVEVATSPPAGQSLENFRPDFAHYDLVLSNYNGALWSTSTQEDFENFVKKGGGVVIVHAANNAFPEWPAYNKIIGLGGWGDRNEQWGPYVYFDEGQGVFVRDNRPGRGGSHGPEHAFQVIIRQKNHPITKGMPPVWMHEKDELYDSFRGPAENMEVLATAFSAKEQKGTGRHEPMAMVIHYGKGRVFHTTLGHGLYSQQGVGFITLLQRGAEWAATGKVTQKIPKDFPQADQGSTRP